MVEEKQNEPNLDHLSDIREWTGEWQPFLEWLDWVVGGKFRIPFNRRPPITRTGNNLMVTNRNDMFVVKPGEKVRVDREKGEFFKA